MSVNDACYNNPFNPANQYNSNNPLNPANRYNPNVKPQTPIFPTASLLVKVLLKHRTGAIENPE